MGMLMWRSSGRITATGTWRTLYIDRRIAIQYSFTKYWFSDYGTFPTARRFTPDQTDRFLSASITLQDQMCETAFLHSTLSDILSFRHSSSLLPRSLCQPTPSVDVHIKVDPFPFLLLTRFIQKVTYCFPPTTAPNVPYLIRYKEEAQQSKQISGLFIHGPREISLAVGWESAARVLFFRIRPKNTSRFRDSRWEGGR